MKGIIVYSVSGGVSPYITFGTQKAALDHAKEESKNPENADLRIDVERVQTVPIDKAMIITLINSAGRYVEKSETIASFERGKRVR